MNREIIKTIRDEWHFKYGFMLYSLGDIHGEILSEENLIYGYGILSLNLSYIFRKGNIKNNNIYSLVELVPNITNYLLFYICHKLRWYKNNSSDYYKKLKDKFIENWERADTTPRQYCDFRDNCLQYIKFNLIKEIILNPLVITYVHVLKFPNNKFQNIIYIHYRSTNSNSKNEIINHEYITYWGTRKRSNDTYENQLKYLSKYDDRKIKHYNQLLNN